MNSYYADIGPPGPPGEDPRWTRHAEDPCKGPRAFGLGLVLVGRLCGVGGNCRREGRLQLEELTDPRERAPLVIGTN